MKKLVALLQGNRRAQVAVFLIYFVLAARYTWPLLLEVGSRVPSDPGDPVLNAAILWWNATNLPFSSVWWNAPHYYPTESISAFTENLVGISPLASPTYWLTGNPIAAYNLAFFVTWPLSAFSVYLLVRFVTKREDAAFLAGLAYGFTPYRTTGLAHIQTLSSYGMPLFLLGLHGYLEERRARWLLLFAVAWVLQSLANGHFMLFGAVLIALWLAYFSSTRRTWRAGVAIIAAWAVASLPLVPIMYTYRVVHDRFGLQRTENEILAYSATPRSWFEVSGDVWLWRSVLPDGKDDLFPGLTVIALVLTATLMLILKRQPGQSVSRSRWWLRTALALVTILSIVAIGAALYVGQWSVTIAGILIRMNSLDRALALLFLSGVPLLLMTRRTREALTRRSPLVFYATATSVMALLCCGPILRVGEEVILTPAPYRWLMALPGFTELRVPPRFWMLGTLCLSVAAGLAFLHVRPASTRPALALFSLLTIGLLLDGWMGVMRMATPPEHWTEVEPRDRTEPILELPIGPDWDWAATFRAAGHRRRVINGVSGYHPPHYVALVAGLSGRDPAMLTAIASLGAFDVVVNRAADPDGAMLRYTSSAPGAVLLADDGSRVVYRIPQAPAEEAMGRELPIAEIRAVRHESDTGFMDDGRIETGWGDFPQEPGQWIQLDLGNVREVGGLTHAIGDYLLDFPRRLAIDLSSDGTTWERVWEGPAAANAFLAYVGAPREAAMRFVFSPRSARFVRLTQLERYRSMWRVSELQVHEPRR